MLRFIGNPADLPACDFESAHGARFDEPVVAIDGNGGQTLLVPAGTAVDKAYFDAVSAGLEPPEKKGGKSPKENKSATPPENK